MLKVRVIPTLLMKDVGLVKGVGFDSWRRIGSVKPAIRVFNTRDVDELVLLDISATRDGRPPDHETVLEMSTECFVPFTVGGGVRNLEDIRNLLRSGADKVCINSAAYTDPALVRKGAATFGAQCMVVSIDARKTGNGQYECFSRAGTHPTGRTPADWAREVEALGAGEILITSVELDGTMEGYDQELIRCVTDAVTIPVIASGGAGNYEHLFQAVKEGQASAVAAASIFQFTQQTPAEAKKYLAGKGIPVRNAFVNHLSFFGV